MKYQTKFGQTIDIPIEKFLIMTDEQLDRMSEKYANMEADVVYFNEENIEEEN